MKYTPRSARAVGTVDADDQFLVLAGPNPLGIVVFPEVTILGYTS
jgi:hypothetical protein